MMAYDYWDEPSYDDDFDDDPRYRSIATRHHGLIREAEIRADQNKTALLVRALRDVASWRRLAAGEGRRTQAGRADAKWQARKALERAKVIRTFIGPDIPIEEIPF